ncbi:ZIP family metal transporter [Ornithinibacillus contaminans]|uniref:hypothetical protein n=1 Tax=Ornithinibacillus contaminans TaxID=694055 RepID=UPI00064DED43|nr:hypothetical protein [Ornithinibacillus contaminans]
MFILIGVYLSFSILAYVVGGIIFYKNNSWNTSSTIPFISGIMITLAITHLIPEAIHLNSISPYFILFGFLITYYIVTRKHFNKSKKTNEKLIMCGILFHSFIESLILISSFHIDSYTGVVLLIGIFIHKITDGFILVLLSKHLFLPFVCLFLSTFLGASIGIIFIGDIISLPSFSFIYALFAGGFFYLAINSLIMNNLNNSYTLKHLAFGISLTLLFSAPFIH